LDLRRIRYFIAVAEERSFTRAAERLHISQPPLSQNVKALEEEIGVQLLVRDRRGVKPTDAGLVFLNQARHLLGVLRHAVDETVRVAAGTSGTVRVGAVTSALFKVYPPVHAALRAGLPNAEVAIYESTSQGQIAQLARDDIDLAIVHGPVDAPGMRVDRLCTERMCAVLPRTHALAGTRPIALSSLAGEEFVLFSRDQSPGFFDSIAAMCVRAGFSPRVRHTAREAQTVVRLVGLGLGVSLVSEALETSNIAASVCFRPLSDPGATIEYCLVSQPEGASELAQKATAIIRRTAAAQRPAARRRKSR
jgi:DNA-binding transcriptional LysR family regulator